MNIDYQLLIRHLVKLGLGAVGLDAAKTSSIQEGVIFLLGAIVTYIWSIKHDDKIAEGATPESFPLKPPGPTVILIPFLALAIVGCASAKQEVGKTIVHPDGTKETWSAKAEGKTLWDGKGTLEKLKVTNGKTQSIGIGQMSNETSSTNINNGVLNLLNLIQGLNGIPIPALQ